MEPLGFELQQASCFDQELLPARARRRECSDKLGLVTVLRMPQLLEQMGMPGNNSQLLSWSRVGPQLGSGWCGVRGAEGTSS